MAIVYLPLFKLRLRRFPVGFLELGALTPSPHAESQCGVGGGPGGLADVTGDSFLSHTWYDVCREWAPVLPSGVCVLWWFRHLCHTELEHLRITTRGLDLVGRATLNRSWTDLHTAQNAVALSSACCLAARCIALSQGPPSAGWGGRGSAHSTHRPCAGCISPPCL